LPLTMNEYVVFGNNPVSVTVWLVL
jgi:hypothetical protein